MLLASGFLVTSVKNLQLVQFQALILTANLFDRCEITLRIEELGDVNHLRTSHLVHIALVAKCSTSVRRTNTLQVAYNSSNNSGPTTFPGTMNEAMLKSQCDLTGVDPLRTPSGFCDMASLIGNHPTADIAPLQTSNGCF